ncbi:SOS response-associated peptidase [Corynebacterium glyciniphilum]|uniref:SOS response-associated peptidase n=1 Tax=Corynebacterium glyciniphilum TaxID=1404244 RepID=UPI003FD30AA4
MCGRYVMFSTTETVLAATSRLVGEQVGAVGGGGTPTPSWNIAPTHTVGVLRRFSGAVTLGPAAWGYPAPWRAGTVLFNARGETVFDKASFRGSAPCLFVMDGWYEWKDRQPYYVSSRSDAGHEPMVVAGLCRPGQGADRVRLEATMVTAASVAPVAWLHDRMPRVLGVGEVGSDETVAWLDGSDGVRRTLAASPPGAGILGTLVTGEADRRVGNVSANCADLIGDAGLTRGSDPGD